MTTNDGGRQKDKIMNLFHVGCKFTDGGGRRCCVMVTAPGFALNVLTEIFQEFNNVSGRRLFQSRGKIAISEYRAIIAGASEGRLNGRFGWKRRCKWINE